MSDSKAQISALSRAEQREQDRKRYSDPAFNRWLDEGISDSGHTVWDAIGDTGTAWAGWENRAYYDDKLRKSVPWPEAVPWQGGLSNDELRREWDLRLPGVEPTDRELSAFAVGIEAGHKIVWVHDPDIERLREAARMALDFCEFCWRDVALNEFAEERRAGVEHRLREALEGQR